MRSGSSLAKPEAGRLHKEIMKVLNMALVHRGTTLVDYRDASGGLGGFQAKLQVYGREGEPCPTCGRKVARKVQGGRSTFFCPRCQKPGRRK